ncbi:MAG: choice-of-anchor B family protein [Flavobacteriia bacterium]|nr:choice-of-anchor B family protein [Flavobacteriia bacterium]
MKKHLLAALALLIGVGSFAQNNPVNAVLLGQRSYTADLNDVWGYADSDGNEYALVGVRNGFSVVDVTVPSTPVQQFFIPGANSTWRDIKTWDHYAYVMHDFSSSPSNNGLLIVDLDSMTNPTYEFIYPKAIINTVEDSATRSHNLWIDENGVLYIFGADVGLGGALMFDLTTDPWNPVYLGMYNSSYLHDGFARGDTLWGAALGNGMVVSDVTNKSQPSFMAQWNTPSTFAHNCWPSDDNKTIFTTDEVSSGYIGAYDVSDLSNVSETDRFRVVPNNQTIPHNAHVLGNFVVTSYYTYGLHILDAQDPSWLIEVGSYDSSPLSGDGYDGAWGAYPFLPSGNILITDIQEGLFIIEATYTPAARIYAFVEDSVTGLPLPAAKVYLKADNDTVPLDAVTAGFRRAKIGSFGDSAFVTLQNYRPIATSFNYQGGVVDTVVFKMLPIDFSVQEGDAGALTLAPNPATDFTMITAPTALSEGEVRILDMNGKLLHAESWNANGNTHKVALNLPEGLYIVEVQSGQTTWTHKLVKH